MSMEALLTVVLKSRGAELRRLKPSLRNPPAKRDGATKFLAPPIQDQEPRLSINLSSLQITSTTPRHHQRLQQRWITKNQSQLLCDAIPNLNPASRRSSRKARDLRGDRVEAAQQLGQDEEDSAIWIASLSSLYFHQHHSLSVEPVIRVIKRVFDINSTQSPL